MERTNPMRASKMEALESSDHSCCHGGGHGGGHCGGHGGTGCLVWRTIAGSHKLGSHRHDLSSTPSLKI